MLPLWGKADFEWWRWRCSPHSPKLQYYWNLTIRLFSVIFRTLVGRCLTLLPRSSQCILHPSPGNWAISFLFGYTNKIGKLLKLIVEFLSEWNNVLWTAFVFDLMTCQHLWGYFMLKSVLKLWSPIILYFVDTGTIINNEFNRNRIFKNR